ncbi:uroporphyrinogen decarboxylase [Chryseolinea serpens]|jgi:uroporphyrinogen decarboxylase|uniref:Uroporphyrinogen decarboxylase n=1 Tax=Chryseolinea serpens TaxID=947013 RepID=A0A1M5WG39_9BACT|nr:uroporphyrinogen decarboxylase [Chryseolinea serpens]SHH86420.1 uroporphyrinogen decarboxylase [Chryseolinea serpens]
MNDRLISAAKGLATDRTPIWLMRQAGRILPEYRKVRETAKDFKTLVKTPELATEVTIQPVDILGVDAAIIFSDILVIPEAMGLNYEMEENKGPVFPKRITSEADLSSLHIAQAEELQYVLDAIRLTKKELQGKVPLIGFAGAPWTIFSYMIEGKGSKTFSQAKKMLYTQPAFSHRLLDMIAQSTIHYLKAQIKAGADIVQIFDSWAGILSPDQYAEFSLKYISKICDALGNDVPKIVFAKGAFFARAEMNTINCDVVGLDWNMGIAESRALLPNKVLQGNLDPCALYGSLDDVRRETKKMLDAFGPHKHIANLGHGLYPDTEVDKVKCYIDTVKEYSATLRR